MKNYLSGLALLTLLLTSCVGTRARNETLLPAMELAWPGVVTDFGNGVQDGIADGDLTEEAAAGLMEMADTMGAAIEARETGVIITLPWESQMRVWAVRGIQSEVDAGRLGPNGAMILLQRVANFTAAVNVLSGAISLAAPPVWDPVEDNPYIVTPSERRLLAALEAN